MDGVSIIDRVTRIISTRLGDFAVFRVGDDCAVLKFAMPLPEEEAVIREVLAHQRELTYDDDTAD